MQAVLETLSWALKKSQLCKARISILTILHLIATERLDFVVGRYSSAELLMLSARIQVLQGHLIAELVLILEEKVRMSADI